MARHRIIWNPGKGTFEGAPEIQIRPHKGSDFTIHLAIRATNESEAGQAASLLSEALSGGSRALRGADDGAWGNPADILAELGDSVDEIRRGGEW